MLNITIDAPNNAVINNFMIEIRRIVKIYIDNPTEGNEKKNYKIKEDAMTDEKSLIWDDLTRAA